MYDPLGLVIPATLLAKVLIRKLYVWKIKIKAIRFLTGMRLC